MGRDRFMESMVMFYYDCNSEDDIYNTANTEPLIIFQRCTLGAKFEGSKDYIVDVAKIMIFLRFPYQGALQSCPSCTSCSSSNSFFLSHNHFLSHISSLCDYCLPHPHCIIEFKLAQFSAKPSRRNLESVEARGEYHFFLRNYQLAKWKEAFDSHVYTQIYQPRTE